MDNKEESGEDSATTAAGTAPGTSSASKRKKSYNMEPRTPLKRARLPVQRFQSPAEEQPPQSKLKSPKEDVELVHKKGIFLAVRGDEGSFYLCRTQQNVFSNTRHFKIQWLDMVEPPDVYKFDFHDHTEIECVLMNVKMDKVARETYRLPESEKARIENILTKALKKEKGELIDEDLTVEEVTEEPLDEEDDDEEWEEEEPSPKKTKKSKTTPKARKSITVVMKPGKNSKPGKKTTRTKALEKEKAEKGKRSALTKSSKKPEKEKKRGPDRKLKPNLKIKVIEKDPLFDTKDHVPFISKPAHQKLVFRAVLLNDMALLKQLKEDDQHIYSLCETRSVADARCAIHYAMERNNTEAASLLIKDYYEDAKTNKRKQKPLPPLLIKSMDTGSYNPTSLGIRFVRKLNVSRGGKEGNAAFTKETDIGSMNEDILDYATTNGVKKETLDNFIANTPEIEQNALNVMKFDLIHNAVIRGHRELAGKLIEEASDKGGYGFNVLHKDVLLLNGEDLKPIHGAASVRKKPFGNLQLTPLHCACINPNTKYLEKLLSIEPDLNLDDRQGRRPIHYAAACDGTGPLEYLLSKGASPYEKTRRKYTPLHYACIAGRARNAEILLKKAKSASNSESDDIVTNKYGVGGVNQPNWESTCPIHIAAANGDIETLKVLIKYGADLNKPLSAGKEKKTPLMLAAGHGHLDVVRLLIQNEAVVEQLDKFKRSALTHSVMNGCTTVASYLLYLGADPNRVDSSGNSLVHYAAAYGWYFVLKLLVNEGNADPRIANDWKITPVGIAFMKGHMGLVDFLLKMPGVDINFKNDTGKTLLSIATSSSLQTGLYEQVVYLMDRGADPKIEDMNGMNALHHLAANTVKTSGHGTEDTYEKRMDMAVKIAELLLEGGSDLSAKTTTGQTAITLAVEMVNTKLVKFLVEKGGMITAWKSETGQNSLHLLAQQCMENELAPLLQVLTQQNKNTDIKENGLDESMEVDNGEKVEDGKAPPDNNLPVVAQLKKEISKSGLDMIKHMVTEVDHEGYTPLLCACRSYMKFTKPRDVKDAQFQKMLQNGRDFIKTLIELAGINNTQTVQKKYFSENPPEEERKQYPDFGKCSAVHFMVYSGSNKLDCNCLGLKIILESKPDIEIRDLDNKTALAVAVEKNYLTAAQLLVQAGSDANVSYKIDKDSDVTILSTAVRNGNVEMVKLLLQGGAKVDVRSSKTNRTALHDAVSCRGNETNTLEIATALLNAGVDINAIDSDKRTAMHLAVNSNSGTSDASTDLEDLLISRSANLTLKDCVDRVPLHYAFFKITGDVYSKLDPIELCSVLTRSMTGGNIIDTPDYWGQSPLHLAACRGATICCVHLVQRGADINKKEHNGNTPLSFAVNKNHDSCAMMLIQKGANVRESIVNKPSMPAPGKAVEKKDTKPVWIWKGVKACEREEHKIHSIFQGAILHELQGVAHMVLDATEIDSSSVEAALRVSQYNVVLRLLKKIKDNGRLSSTNDKRQNLLHILALHTTPGSSSELQMKVANVLLERGLSLNTTDENGCTPLHYAALKHQPSQLAKLFIEKDSKLDLSKKDKFDRTVLAAFLWNHNLVDESTDESQKWLTLLLSKGANLDILYDFPLSDVAMFDTVTSEVPDYFTTASAYRISPLIFSINFFKLGLTKYLLQHNASPNFKDTSGLTPLMHAVKKNDLCTVKTLLNYSYDPDEGTKSSEDKPKLSKKLSRQVFVIKPITSTTEEEEDDDKAADDDEDQDEDAEDDQDYDDAEDDVDDDNQDDEEPPEEDEEVLDEGDEDPEEEEEDSDHDTDVMDDDEEEEHKEPVKFPSIVRLGSKQPSLLRQGSSSLVKDEFDVVEKTSPVNLKDTDTQGWTVIHHLVSPLEYGTFDNEEILYVLSRCGAETQTKDKAGLSPLDHALIRGATKLAQRLQKISAVESEKMEKPTFASFEVEDSAMKTASVDYQTDSQEMLKQISEKQMDTNDEDTNQSKASVDENCQIKNMGEVVSDVSQGIPYDVLLSKVDVSCGTWGMYNFYKMQIVYQKAVDMYVLFTRWGRIGDRGQFQHTPFPKKADAITEFGKIFRSKTGNYWSSIGAFKNQPKKYRLVPRETKPQKVHKIEFSLKSDIPSKLSPPVQDLMKEMTRVNMLTAAVNKAGLDSDIVPFGRIKRESLIEAKKLLNELGEVIKLVEDMKKRVMTKEETELYQSRYEQISKLTNEYYHLLPCEGYAHEKINPISDHKKLIEQSRLLADLLDLECASRILLGAESKLSQMNPLDYVYHAIGCKIQLLNEDSAEAQYILKYIYASSQRSKVQAIYKIARPNEEESLRSLGIANHKLLWHGSSVSNFISILHRGLLMSPPEVPMTGNLFGDGVYFADTFEKSAMYCSNYSCDSKVKLMTLSEVALGESQTFENEFLYSDLFDTDFQSRKIDAPKEPDPEFDVSLPYGAALPIGQLKKTPKHKNDVYYFGPQHTEYIVQNTSQICLRYLIQFV